MCLLHPSNNGGKVRTIQTAIAKDGGRDLLLDFARHSPSVVAGVALYIYSPRGPQYMIGIIASTIAFAYLTMAATGTSLEEAQDMSFFWRKEEVMTPPGGEPFDYGPPSAFGLWSPTVLAEVSWPAFVNGLPGVVAMSVIYLLRCSLHAGEFFEAILPPSAEAV